MVLDAVSNFVRGRADAQLTAGATTLSVEDASIFPDPEEEGEYNVVIWDANNFPRPDQDLDVEIVRVTGRDTGTNELTVVRGQETTSDVAHPEGSAVHLSPTAKMFSDIEDTFADFWDSGTQELTADVNNESVSTGSLENGIAGDGNTISSVMGDSGEVIYGIYPLALGESFNVNSDTFSTFGDFWINGSLRAPEVTNAEARLVAAVGFSVDNLNDGAGQVTVRFQDSEETELTIESESFASGAFGPVRDGSLNSLEAKVDTGNADIRRVGIATGVQIR